MTRTIKLSTEQASMLVKLASNECEAYKNWIASSVENNDFTRAKMLTEKLRDHQIVATLLRSQMQGL